MASKVVPFPQPRPRPEPKPVVEPAAAELIGSLAGLFRTAGCPELAEAFRVEAGGRCG